MLHKLHTAPLLLTGRAVPLPIKSSTAPVRAIRGFALALDGMVGLLVPEQNNLLRIKCCNLSFSRKKKCLVPEKKIKANLKAYIKKYNHISPNDNSFRGCLEVLKCLL